MAIENEMDDGVAKPARAGGFGRGIDTTKPIWRVIGMFLIPLMLSNTLQSISGTLGSIILGRTIGVNALATVSAFFPVFFFLISFVIGIGSASSVMIGQAYGARDTERMKAIVGTTLVFTFGLGLILAILGTAFAWNILGQSGTPSNILHATVVYARINFVALPVLFVYAVYTTFLRGTGDAKTPFYFLLISTVLGLVLTPAFILGWVGLPRLGINGVAVANIASTLITFLLLLLYLARTQHPLRLDRKAMRYLKIRGSLLKTLIVIGIPTSIQMVMISLSEIAVISFVNHFGSHATAAYGAVNQVASYVQMPAISLGIAASIFGAQSIGAGRVDRLTGVIRAGVTLNYIVGGVLVTLAYLFSRSILSWFITDPSTLFIAHRLLTITLWSYLIFGNTSVLSGLMRSSGKVLWPTLISIVSIWAVEVPTAYIFSHRIGIEGIWIGYPVAFVVALLLQSGYYFLFWKRQRHTRLAT